MGSEWQRVGEGSARIHPDQTRAGTDRLKWAVKSRWIFINALYMVALHFCKDLGWAHTGH